MATSGRGVNRKRKTGVFQAARSGGFPARQQGESKVKQLVSHDARIADSRSTHDRSELLKSSMALPSHLEKKTEGGFVISGEGEIQLASWRDLECWERFVDILSYKRIEPITFNLKLFTFQSSRQFHLEYYLRHPSA
jgi:hypothetical protein